MSFCKRSEYPIQNSTILSLSQNGLELSGQSSLVQEVEDVSSPFVPATTRGAELQEISEEKEGGLMMSQGTLEVSRPELTGDNLKYRSHWLSSIELV